MRRFYATRLAAASFPARTKPAAARTAVTPPIARVWRPWEGSKLLRSISGTVTLSTSLTADALSSPSLCTLCRLCTLRPSSMPTASRLTTTKPSSTSAGPDVVGATTGGSGGALDVREEDTGCTGAGLGVAVDGRASAAPAPRFNCAPPWFGRGAAWAASPCTRKPGDGGMGCVGDRGGAAAGDNGTTNIRCGDRGWGSR